jgi:hypothetical protein
MRMARVNITMPDDVVAEAKAAGLNLSQVATAAIADALDRQSKIDLLDEYLAELEAEFGPPSEEEVAEAEAWAAKVFGDKPTQGRRSA